jgi:sirohydrochlorin cobaltochelatase
VELGRLPVIRAWRRSALILVAHGSNRCPGPGQQLERHAHALARRGLFAEVCTATLQGGRSPGEALRSVESERVYVMPMFMCNGQYTRDRVPEAFGLLGAADRPNGRMVHLCPPIGLDPGLAVLASRRATERLDDIGISAAGATLLLIGHGSPTSSASRQATESQALRIRGTGAFSRVETAYLEEPPAFVDVLSALSGSVVVVALLAAQGPHAREDIGRLIAEDGRRDVAYIGAIGGDEAIPEVILESLWRFCGAIVDDREGLAIQTGFRRIFLSD